MQEGSKCAKPIVDKGRFTLPLILAAIAFGPRASAESPKTRTPYTFTDADALAIPDRATDGHPFTPGSVSLFRQRAPRYTLVDLHAHAFMDRGLGLLFDGDFQSPLRSTNWSDLFSSQINADTLEASGLGLIVVSLYAHPLFAPARQQSIRQQIADARAFVQTHPDWVIARNPHEARDAYARGKRVMVLSLEGASGILDTEEDIKELVDEDGISIVTFAHLADDKLTGAALLSSYNVLGNPRGLVSALLGQKRSPDGKLLNPHGLTPYGRWVASRLIAHHVWIDLAHASEETSIALMTMMLEAGQPLLYTHMGLGTDASAALSSDLLRVVSGSGGIMGLVPGESIVGATHVPAENCPSACNGQCKGGVYALAAQFNAIASVIGDDHTFIGSDFNGAQVHLPPSHSCATGTTLDARGLYNISQTGELWAALLTAGARVKPSQEHGVENFLAVWEKVYAH
jgi:microsomal dipeptidase-like Zn-dependent dipeptidase